MRELVEIIQHTPKSKHIRHSNIYIYYGNDGYSTSCFRLINSDKTYELSHCKTLNEVKNKIENILIQNSFMKTLITKTGKFIDLTPPETRSAEEVLKDLYTLGMTPYQQKYEPIEEYTEITVSDETFKFIESVATIEVEFYGDRTYIINNLKFKLKQDERN